MAMPMQAFLNNHSDQLRNKTIALICTGGSSGISQTVADAPVVIVFFLFFFRRKQRPHLNMPTLIADNNIRLFTITGFLTDWC